LKDSRGFALLGVMLMVALLTVVILEATFAMRLEAAAGRSFRQNLLASHLAEAGLQQAIREMASRAPIQAVNRDGVLVFFHVIPGSSLPRPLHSLARAHVPLGPGDLSYRITDEEGRLNLNRASPERVSRLLRSLGLDRPARDALVDALEDWKDADELHRPNGAESDYYLRLPFPYRARNAPLQDTVELLQIRGVTHDLYHGRDGRPGLAELTTVFGGESVNLNTASPLILSALGLSGAEIQEAVSARVRAPYTVVPARWTGRGLGVGSGTFRVEAEGRVDGARPARIVAVVGRRPTPVAASSPDTLAALGMVLLSWRAGEEP
jgi:general secretion pathway protein K